MLSRSLLAVCLPMTLLGCAVPQPEVPPPPGMPGEIVLADYPADQPGAEFFATYTVVFGVSVLASEQTPEAKVLHAAHVLAQYLDNDEDGEPDDPAVVEAMVAQQAAMIMFATEEEAEGSGVFESPVLDAFVGQGLWGEETAPSDGFDASLEEVLHLISDTGYAAAYPEAFSPEPGSELTDAMDLARGGQFFSIPDSYPAAAWYHYDDETCDYRCMATEYLYWALTTALGAQADAARCADIAVEWELCTREALEEGDPAVFELLTDGRYVLPTVLPDGAYRAP